MDLTAPAVLTVSLNPAIDQTILIDRLAPGSVHRAIAMHSAAGGKGVNVATALAAAGIKAAATGFLGAGNAAVHERHLQAAGITDRFLRIPGDTRTNVKIVEQGAPRTTDLNLPGLAPTAEDLTHLEQEIRASAAPGGWVILTGGLPPGVPVDLYARLVNLARSLGCRAALDTSGEALRLGAKAGPALMKPNLEELEQAAGQKLESREEIFQAAEGLFEYGVAQVIVSMGAEGALFLREGARAAWAVPPPIRVNSTVGAGDALLAGWVAAENLLAGADDALYHRRAALAVAFSAAAVERTGSGFPPLPEIMRLSDDVKIYA